MNIPGYKNAFLAALIWLTVGAVSAPAVAFAQDGTLKLEGDLMIHPDQMAKFFTIGAEKIKTSGGWTWPSMQFTKPYKTAWSDVMAVGPFDIQFDTQKLKNQEFSFDLLWANPRINIGQFEIHDTLTRVVGGIPLRFHLDGTCTGMSLETPGGRWHILGKMRWDYSANQFVLSWLDFKLDMNQAATPVVNIGQCQGPPDLFKALNEAMVTVAKDQGWLEDVFRGGALDWLQTNLGALHQQLLVPREVKLKEDVALGWQPTSLAAMSGGLIRVAGQFTITKPGVKTGGETVVRSYDPAVTLTQVQDSGFVMPKETVQKIIGYMYSNRELQYRVKSNEVQSFTALMQSRFLQFFVWPDLMAFAKNTQFYFDLTTAREPKLSNGNMLTGGGSAYDFTGPLLVHQWAPGKTAYVPYVDFSSAVGGQVYATLKNGQLQLDTRLNKMNVKAQFRREYSLLRNVTTWISTSLLGSRAKSYIESNPVQVAVPDWDFDHGLSLGLRDVQAWPESFRIPLDFKSKP